MPLGVVVGATVGGMVFILLTSYILWKFFSCPYQEKVYLIGFYRISFLQSHNLENKPYL